MPRRAEAFLKDIERSIEKIRNYTEGYDFERSERRALRGRDEGKI